MTKASKSSKSAKTSSSKVSLSNVIRNVQGPHAIVGREAEIEKLYTAVAASRNVLIEGPVGVGKTALAQAVVESMKKGFIRVDGDSRFTEQKMTGWFDPAQVMKKGYTNQTFIPGPLVRAMKEGSILFINELNRMPEAVQNVLLPAIDEGLVHIPQLGEVRAKPGFLVVATQNPREFVATSHLSEALMDRMEWVQLGYQSFEEEIEIAKRASGYKNDPYLTWAVALVRSTRKHPKIKRGASVRAAIALLKMLAQKEAPVTEETFWACARLALPTRIELNSAEAEGGAYDQQIEAILQEIVEDLKKKSLKGDLSLLQTH